MTTISRTGCYAHNITECSGSVIISVGIGHEVILGTSKLHISGFMTQTHTMPYFVSEGKNAYCPIIAYNAIWRLCIQRVHAVSYSTAIVRIFHKQAN